MSLKAARACLLSAAIAVQALCLPAAPALAQDAAKDAGQEAGQEAARDSAPMTAAGCAASWAAFLDLFDMPARYGKGAPVVSESGWCRIDRTTTQLDDQDFEVLLWRGDDLSRAGKTVGKGPGLPPRLEVLFLGVPPLDARGLFPGTALLTPDEGERPRGTLNLAYRADPADRSLLIEGIQLDYPGEGFIRLTGRLSGVDISTPAATQMSLGAARLREARLVADLNGALARTLWPGDGPMGALNAAPYIAAIPQAAIDADSRAALLRWANAGPAREGRLALSLRAGPGLGLMQVGAAIAQSQTAKRRPDRIAQTAAILLSGVTLTAEWAPAQ